MNALRYVILGIGMVVIWTGDLVDKCWSLLFANGPRRRKTGEPKDVDEHLFN